MIRSFFFLILFFTALQLYAQPLSNTKDLERLGKFRSEYCQSMMDKKVERLHEYVFENARLMPEFQKTIVGKTHVISYWSAFTIRFDVEKCSRAETESLDLGGQIFETGTISLNVKLRSTGKQYELKGKYVDLWQKTNDKLVLITSAWNYDHATDLQNELRFSEVPNVNVAMEQHLPVNNAISFELAALNQLMEATIVQHDVTLWKQFYSDEGSFLYTGTAPVRGRKAIGEFLDHHVKGLPVFEKLDVRNDRIDDLGTYVIEYASHIAIVRNGDWSGVFTGKDLAIWRREKNGSLKIFRHIATYD